MTNGDQAPVAANDPQQQLQLVPVAAIDCVQQVRQEIFEDVSFTSIISVEIEVGLNQEKNDKCDASSIHSPELASFAEYHSGRKCNH